VSDVWTAYGDGWNGVQDGSSPYLTADAFGIDWSAGLLQFDLSGIAPDAIVEEATLQLFHLFNPQFGQFIQVFDVTQAWTETEGTGPTAPLYGALPVASLLILDEDVGVARSWDIGQLVEQWVDGTSQNFGLLVAREAATLAYPYFASRDAPNTALRPLLRISYSVPEVVAAPIATPSIEDYIEDSLGDFVDSPAGAPPAETPEPASALLILPVLVVFAARHAQKR